MEGQGSTRPERKTIEKNRRIHMKALCSKLDSLLPPSPQAREVMAVPLPDRIDEAIRHIKGLQERIEKMKERKKQLMKIGIRQMEGEHGGLLSPWSKIEVQDLGSGGLKIIVMSTVGNWALFYNAVEALEEEGIQIVAANYDVVNGDKALHIIHASVTAGRRLEVYELFKIIADKAAHGGE